jgi:O-antigen/teichoic acid export membrane protein
MIGMEPSTERTPASRGIVSRFLLLLDQAIFSIANFILTIVLARHYAAAEFGAYGVGLATALTVQFVQRNLYIVSLSLMSERVALRSLPGILAKHIVITGGTVAILGLATAVLIIAGAQGATVDVVVATLSCTAVYFQADFDRAVLVKRGGFVGAVLLSVFYLGIVLALFALVQVMPIGFDVFMGMLGCGCLAKGGWLLLLRIEPRWRWGMRFIARDWRHYGVPTLLSAAATAAYTNVPVMVLAATRGPAEVAGMMAMRSLTMPLNLVLRSFDAVDKNRLRALSGGSSSGVRRVFWRTILSYGALGAAAMAVLALFSHPIIAIVYHDRYAGFTGLLLAWCAYCALLGLMQPLHSVVLLTGKQMSSTRLATISGVLAVAIALVTCRRFGATGAMTATLTAAALNVVLSGFVVRAVIFGSHELPLPKERRVGRD